MRVQTRNPSPPEQEDGGKSEASQICLVNSRLLELQREILCQKHRLTDQSTKTSDVSRELLEVPRFRRINQILLDLVYETTPLPPAVFLSHIYWPLSQTNLAVFVPLRYSPIPRLVCFYPPSLFRGDGHLAVCRCLLRCDALLDFSKQRCPADTTAVFLHSLA